MTIHVSLKHKKVMVPAEGSIVGILGQTRVTLMGKEYLVIDHGVEETKLLRNLGHDVPAPILSQYDFEGGSPFQIQKQTAALLTQNYRAYVLNSFGTGKTKSALWAWRFLNKQGLAGKALVIAPLSTLSFTWAREVFATLPGVKVVVLHGSKTKRLERLKDPDADIYVINHDGLSVIQKELEARTDIDTLILDELAVYRNATATRTKVMRKFAPKYKWVWGMTGSPTPNEPTDAWAQCSIITPNTVPQFFRRFRDDTMTKLSQFKYVPKKDAVDKVFACMQPAVRFTLNDVAELPELVERVVDVDLGPEQKRVYDTMLRHARVMAAAQEITAQNAGAVMMKLLQISTGYVYTSDGRTVALDNEARLTAITDAVNSCNEKAIIFVSFKHALAGIAQKLTDEGNTVEIVSGDTSAGERGRIFNAFQNEAEPRVIVAHPACMAHGITLTAASMIIWDGPTTSLETFEQANARITRVGQKNRQQVLMLQSTPIEKKMYARLRAKQKVQNMLLDMFSESSDVGEDL